MYRPNKKAERNEAIRKEFQAGFLTAVELARKYKITRARLYQICYGLCRMKMPKTLYATISGG